MAYQLFTFGEELPGKLKKLKLRWSQKDVQTTWSTSNSTGLNTDTSFYKILRQMFGFDTEKAINIATEPNLVVTEVYNLVENRTEQIALSDRKSDGLFKVREMNEKGALLPYGANRKGTVLKACLLGHYLAQGDSELIAVVNDLKPLVQLEPDADDWDDPLMLEVLGKKLCLLTNNLYYHYKSATGTMQAKTEDFRQSTLKKVTENTALKPWFNPVKFLGQTAKTAPKQEKIKKGQYFFNPNRKLTAYEEMLVPTMPDTYVDTELVKTILLDLFHSTMFKKPIRNILFTGIAGSGKTTLAMSIAEKIGLPHKIFTCGPDTDGFGLIGQLLPNTRKAVEKVSNICKKIGLPTFEDVENDFEGAYEKLFGKKPTVYNSPSDCYNEISRRCMEENSSLSSDFVFVKSPIIEALENGWVIEIQEPTIIKRETVLEELNALLEYGDTAVITLPTGEVIRRHPDAVVIFTTNLGYAGCKSLQQAVLSRVDERYDLQLPTTKELVKRCISNTGFPNEQMLTTMVNCCHKVAQYCGDHDITDGICGPRELDNWAKKAMLLSMRWEELEVTEECVIASAFPTMLSKATQVYEDLEDILTGAFYTYYEAHKVQEAKELYEAGKV
ncbi:MAG: hypothetical protein J6A75_13240 [Lachnospiraceae bacterium]|nr:hypothetical protein [Lachnospiraceae bacterium]